MFSLWTILTYLAGMSLTTVVGLFLAAIIAPSFFAEFIKPIGGLVGQGLSWAIRNFFEGIIKPFKAADSALAVLLTCFFIWTGASLYYTGGIPSADRVCVSRVDYKLIERTTAERKAYVKKAGLPWWKAWF